MRNMTNNYHEPVSAHEAVYFIFGATGDLARRKLFPALYSLYREGKLGERFAIVGLARRPRSNDQFRDDVYEAIKEFCRYRPSDSDSWNAFVEHFTYQSLDINNVEGFRTLKAHTEELEAKYSIPGNRLFYLALAPELFGHVSRSLRDGGMLESQGWRHLVIEKPFGYDYASAEKLNEEISEVFREDEVYRIDHYLGKEMVQNIEVIRFANAFFEPLWNKNHIANVQITLAETVGVEDRGAYYNKSGALRDMVQNHLLQMLTMVAMEPPSRLDAEDIRDEKVKVLRSIRKMNTRDEVVGNVIRGQYAPGTIKGKELKGYRDEDSVDSASVTETFFAATLYVDNFRWAGVPFYVRTGKRLPVKSTEIVIEFKNVPNHVLFANKQNVLPNLLVIRVNPMEGIYIKLNAKKPGNEMAIQTVATEYCQSCQTGINTPEAYERLIFDAARGDSTYFTRWDELALAWKLVDPIAAAWKQAAGDLQFYPAGSWGPDKVEQMLAEDGHHWWPVNGQDEDNVIWISNSGK